MATALRTTVAELYDQPSLRYGAERDHADRAAEHLRSAIITAHKHDAATSDAHPAEAQSWLLA